MDLCWTYLILSLLAILTLLYYFHSSGNIKGGLPPGPLGLPILGYLPFIRQKKRHLQFERLMKKYGDVFSFRCTGRLYVHVGTFKSIREALVTKADCFGKRNENFNLMRDMFRGGITFINDDKWRVHRKFYVASIKERGYKSLVTGLNGRTLYDSIEATVSELRTSRGEPIDIVEAIFQSCTEAMLATFFEGGLPVEVIGSVNEYFGKVMSLMEAPNFLSTGNLAKYVLFPLKAEFRACQALRTKTFELLFKFIEERKSNYDENISRDFIDDFIKERNDRRKKGDPTAKYFTDQDLVGSLIQLIGDSSLSVSAFCAVFVQSAADHPREQERIYLELQEVVGEGRNPSLEDRPRLPYTGAFIQEALRTSTEYFPYFPSQECIKETTISGYRIPKGSVMLVDYYTSNNDPEIYENPEKFDPTRFFAKEGKQKPDQPTMFGYGKRMCIAEAYSMLQVFLFLTTMIKNFRISRSANANSSLDELLSTGKCPIVLHPRNQK